MSNQPFRDSAEIMDSIAKEVPEFSGWRLFAVLCGGIGWLLGPPWWEPIAIATGYWIPLGELIFLVVICALIFPKSPLKARHLGLIRAKIPMGLLVLTGFWGLIQILSLLLSIILTGSIILNPSWLTSPFSENIRIFVTAVFGPGLCEELIFRGFLLPQVFVKFHPKIQSRKNAWVIAIALSSGIFAAAHIPVEIYYTLKISGWWGVTNGLLNTFTVGCLLSFIFLRTRNISTAIVVHGLYDSIFVITIVGTNIWWTYFLWILSIMFLIAWPRRWHFKRVNKKENAMNSAVTVSEQE